MMIKKWLLVCFTCFFLSTSVSQEVSSDLQEVFDDFELMGMSVFIGNGNESSSYHFGFRDLDRGLEVTQNTQYRIASISKAFTALGAMKLVDDGLIDLDEDISGILGYTIGNPNFPSTPITLRMLLSHQSSLQDGTGYFDFLNATYSETPIPNISEVLLASGSYFTNNMWRNETPGTYFTYSNINFGLIGTLIEAVTGERFDIYMKNEILQPLGIEGSFNIQDIADINNVAVLYRNNGGWQPQFDNYQGVYPTPPDLSNYIPGTNGVYFAPQGGLRISAEDTAKFLSFLRTNGDEGSLNISQNTLLEMISVQWDYNGSNGNNYFDLFNRWGLGLHHANVNEGDQICNLGSYGSFLGHAGEAYGLISDAYFSSEENVELVLIINGAFNGYQPGENSAFYTVEEAVYAVICEAFQNSLGVTQINDIDFVIAPIPASDEFEIRTDRKDIETVTIYDMLQKVKYRSQGISKKISIVNWQAGLYFIHIKTKTNSFYKKIIIE